MKRFRSHWLAILGAGALVSLSVTSVFAAHPENASSENRGHEVSAYVHSLLLGSDESADQTDEDSNEQDSEEQQFKQQLQDQQSDEEQQSEDEQQSEEQSTADVTGAQHGACVSEVARGNETGGPNDNHGGAVSTAARDTCWQADPSAGEEPQDPTDPPTEVSDGPGNSEHGNQGNHGGKKK
jgi:TolA-binding protein